MRQQEQTKYANGNVLFNIAVLLPNDDEYWVAQNMSIATTAAQYETLGVHLQFYTYDRKDKISLYYKTQEVLFSCPDGVIVAPLLRDEMLRFTRELDMLDIPYVFVHEGLNNTNPLTQIWLDQKRAGFFAAETLKSDSLPVSLTFIVRFEEEYDDRIQGLVRYYESHGLDSKEIREVILPDDIAIFLSEIENCRMTEVVHFFVPGPLSFQLVDILKNFCRQFKIVGFDLSTGNEKCLESEAIDYIIDQNPEMQGQLAMESLCDWLILNKAVPKVQTIEPRICTNRTLSMSHLKFSGY